MMMARRVPYRCRQCSRRFFRFSSDNEPESLTKGDMRADPQAQTKDG
jgi:hypothetical protein